MNFNFSLHDFSVIEALLIIGCLSKIKLTWNIYSKIANQLHYHNDKFIDKKTSKSIFPDVISDKLWWHTDQFNQFDNTRCCLEIANIESDLQGLWVGPRVRHHRHVGLRHRGGLGAAVVVVHHTGWLSFWNEI